MTHDTEVEKASLFGSAKITAIFILITVIYSASVLIVRSNTLFIINASTNNLQLVHDADYFVNGYYLEGVDVVSDEEDAPLRCASGWLKPMHGSSLDFGFVQGRPQVDVNSASQLIIHATANVQDTAFDQGEEPIFATARMTIIFNHDCDAAPAMHRMPISSAGIIGNRVLTLADGKKNISDPSLLGYLDGRIQMFSRTAFCEYLQNCSLFAVYGDSVSAPPGSAIRPSLASDGAASIFQGHLLVDRDEFVVSASTDAESLKIMHPPIRSLAPREDVFRIRPFDKLINQPLFQILTLIVSLGLAYSTGSPRVGRLAASGRGLVGKVQSLMRAFGSLFVNNKK